MALDSAHLPPTKRVLPRRLARSLYGEVLPSWVAKCCGLPEGSTAAALGDKEPPSEPAARAAIEFYATELLRKHAAEIRALRVLPEGKPVRGDAADFKSWPAKALKAINQDSRLGDIDQLRGVTYGDLMALRGFGPKSVLNFAMFAEELVVSNEEGLPPVDATQNPPVNDLEKIRQSLQLIAESDWAASVVGKDKRWRGLHPRAAGTLSARAECLLAELDTSSDGRRVQGVLALTYPGDVGRISDVQSWCEKVNAKKASIEAMPLEDLLRDLLEQCSGLGQSRLDALLARLGWSGSPPITLEETGQMLGVTRERIRQIENKIKKGLPPPPVFAPALDRALKTLYQAAPIAVDEAATLLVEKGVSQRPYSPESVLEASETLGLDCPVTITETRGVRMVTAASRASHVGRALLLARKASGSAGVVNCADLAAKVSQESQVACTVEEVQTVLRSSPTFRSLGGTWFWATDLPPGRNRVVNICRKVLSVTAPIKVQKLRDGLKREFTFRNLSSSGRLDLRVPPLAVLRAFLVDHPDFELDGADYVLPSTVLDYRVELGESDCVLVDVLRSSPSNVLDRSSLIAGCISRGINLATVSSDLSYSCLIEHVDTNIWTIRGADINPAAIEALRRANAMRPREKRVRNFGWTSSGRLWVAAVVPSAIQTFVFGCPAGAREFVLGQKFDAQTTDGLQCGKIGVTSDGTAYGLNSFMSISGADEGDLLIVEFDLVARTATLISGDEELLESYGEL